MLWQAELEHDRAEHDRRNKFIGVQYLRANGLTGDRAQAILHCASLDRPMTFEEIEQEIDTAAQVAVDYWKER